MDKLSWIKDLVRAEQQMEESGVIDFDSGLNAEQILVSQSVEFLNNLKAAFVDAATAFNQLKSSTLGRLKIYGISNTTADFMLFRNGLKLIFTLREPGVVGIRFHYVGTHFLTQPAQTSDSATAALPDEDVLQAHWGAFGDLVWHYKGQPIKIDYLTRYYMTRFVRESTK